MQSHFHEWVQNMVLELVEEHVLKHLRTPMTVSADSQRKKREIKRKIRQAQSNFDLDQIEATAGIVNTRTPTTQTVQKPERQSNATGPSEQDSSSNFNPENPYHVSTYIFALESPSEHLILQVGM